MIKPVCQDTKQPAPTGFWNCCFVWGDWSCFSLFLSLLLGAHLAQHFRACGALAHALLHSAAALQSLSNLPPKCQAFENKTIKLKKRFYLESKQSRSEGPKEVPSEQGLVHGHQHLFGLLRTFVFPTDSGLSPEWWRLAGKKPLALWNISVLALL